MAARDIPGGEHGTRRSLLELAPLELECMNTLWPLGEASVRDIQNGLAPTLSRAYTTIMTIMDRLTQKGIVERRKSGRAYMYRPSLSPEQARDHAVAQIVRGFFDGSAEALAVHLSGKAISAEVARPPRRPHAVVEKIPSPAESQAVAQPPASLDTTLL